MRKSLIAAGAAVAVIAGAGVAYAQLAPPAIVVKPVVSPSKAGTKKSPKATKLTLTVTNNVNESKATASQIKVTLPSTLRLSTKRLPQCTKSDAAILNAPTTACKKSKAGSGTAHAILSPYASPSTITFKLTAFVGKNQLLFYLDSPTAQAVLHGKISGRTMTIRIPDGTRDDEPNLQQPVTGLYSALQDLKTTLSFKKGKHALITSTGCKGGGHKVTVTETFVPNPTPPAASTATSSGIAPCKK